MLNETINDAIETFGAKKIYDVACARLKGNKNLWNQFFYEVKSLEPVNRTMRMAFERLNKNEVKADHESLMKERFYVNI